MSSHYRQLTQDVSANLAPLNRSLPSVMKGFGNLSQAAMTDGALDAKTKELIALAIGVAVRCDGCIAFHAKALAGQSATAKEVHEALAVAVYMGGGPSLMYSASAAAAFDEFSAAGGRGG